MPYEDEPKAFKTFPSAVNRRLRAIMNRVVDVHFNGSPSEAAKGLGVSQPHISQLRKGETERGFGPVVLIQLARFLDADIRDMVDLSVDIEALVFRNSQKRVMLDAAKFAERLGIPEDTIYFVNKQHAGTEKSSFELVALMLEREAEKRRPSPKVVELQKALAKFMTSKIITRY